MSPHFILLILCVLWGMVTALFGYGPVSFLNITGLILITGGYAFFYLGLDE